MQAAATQEEETRGQHRPRSIAGARLGGMVAMSVLSLLLLLLRTGVADWLAYHHQLAPSERPDGAQPLRTPLAPPRPNRAPLGRALRELTTVPSRKHNVTCAAHAVDDALRNELSARYRWKQWRAVGVSNACYANVKSSRLAKWGNRVATIERKIVLLDERADEGEMQREGVRCASDSEISVDQKFMEMRHAPLSAQIAVEEYTAKHKVEKIAVVIKPRIQSGTCRFTPRSCSPHSAPARTRAQARACTTNRVTTNRCTPQASIPI